MQMIKYWVPKEDELKLLSFIDNCLFCLLSAMMFIDSDDEDGEDEVDDKNDEAQQR